MKQPRPKLLLEQLTQRTAKQETSSSSSSDYTQFVLAVMTVAYYIGPVKSCNNQVNAQLHQ